MTTPEGMTPTQQRQRRLLLLALLLFALACFASAGFSFWLGGSDEMFSWLSFLSGIVSGLVIVLALARYVIQPRMRRHLAAAQRKEQDRATLEALEPLGPTSHDGAQR